MQTPLTMSRLGAAWLVALALASCETTRTVTVTSRAFGTSIPSVDANGNLLPLVHLDLAQEEFALTRRFPLGGARFLEVRSNVSWLDDADLERLSELVGAGYRSVEGATGRSVAGSTLFFLMQIDSASHSYSIRYEGPPAETDVFAWASILTFEPGERIAREPLAPAVWMDGAFTLAHELTHGVLEAAHLAHDENGEALHRTRWFADGAAEWVGVHFGREQFPDAARWYCEDMRQLGSVLENEEIRARVFDWAAPAHFFGESAEPGPPPYELELYGAAFLLMEAWLRHTTLAEVLDRLEASAAPVDGDDLFRILRETTGLDPDGLLAEAREIAQEYDASASGAAGGN